MVPATDDEMKFIWTFRFARLFKNRMAMSWNDAWNIAEGHLEGLGSEWKEVSPSQAVDDEIEEWRSCI